MLVVAAHAWGKVRRFLLCHFRPDYVRESISRRHGECRRCGDCCRILFRCPFLKNGNSCTIYKMRSRACRMFPIDRRDLADVPTCAFHFDGGSDAPESSLPTRSGR